MLFQLLEEASGGTATPSSNSWVSYALIGILLVVLVGSMFFMNRRSKKREAEAKALIDAVKPGNKVKTIGGICGIVVEVDPDEDTFVLETGSEASGKCYMKFVRQAILESDAVVDTKTPAKKEEPAEAKETPAEETSAEEAGAEMKDVEKMENGNGKE